MKSELRLSDLYRAAFFTAAGLTITRIDREGPKCFFVFEAGEKTEELSQAWASRTATVNAVAFSHSIKDLKALVHER